jgi:hypothetical protein
LLSVPKPYAGIHPKVVINSVAKKESQFKKKVDTTSIYIPNRDIQSYDDLIPIALYMIPTFSTGGALWS